MKKYVIDSWNHNVLVKFNKYIATFGIQIVKISSFQFVYENVSEFFEPNCLRFAQY